jgi:hypothetical protein
MPFWQIRGWRPREPSAGRGADVLDPPTAGEATESESMRAGLRRPLDATQWAILDSNQGPPPYQSGALTN